MRSLIHAPSALAAIAAFLGSLAANPARAQTFTTLHAFTGASDGALPYGRLILSSDTLYGTTYARAFPAGWDAQGTVFSVQTDGAAFNTLHEFGATGGRGPIAGLALSGDTLYGTTALGGTSGNGTIFAVTTDGSIFSDLHAFTSLIGQDLNDDGCGPRGELILSANRLYGTAWAGGSTGGGTLFALNIDGTGFTNLYNFSFFEVSGPSALILSEDTLYGMAYRGGASGNGAIFKINPDGTDFTNLHSLAGPPGEGAYPLAGLILAGPTLYGTTSEGGPSRNGTVFAVNLDGTGFTNLHSFTASSGPRPETNRDGAGPIAGVIISGDTLYGTTSRGGRWGNGSVFAVKTNGTDFTTLYSFTPLAGPPRGTNVDGATPQAGLLISGSTLYGATTAGGSYGVGTLFSISLLPKLEIARVLENVVLTWPTSYAGFEYTGYTLQSTTNLGSAAIWITNSSAPRIVDGRYTITNPISGTRQFFRLSH